MLDLAFVRNNLPLVEEKLLQRGMDPFVVLGDFYVIDLDRRAAITNAETMKAHRNKLTEEFQQLRKAQQDTAANLQQQKDLKEKIAEAEKIAEEADARLRDILAGIPNLPNDTVPVGKTADDNVEVRRWGTPPRVRLHSQAALGTGRAVWASSTSSAPPRSPARASPSIGTSAPASSARWSTSCSTCTPASTATPKSCRRPRQCRIHVRHRPASQVRGRPVQGPAWATSNLYLIPTAEVPVTNLYRDETLDAARLPISLTAYTPCFRSEAGSYGKDVRGIIRQHQFQKVELVKFTRPGAVLRRAREADAPTPRQVLQKLDLHYRTVVLCTGDMGFSSAKTYDIEVWLPGQSLFREISSCSNFEAFQARRANIRYRPEGKKQDRIRAHAQRQRPGGWPHLGGDCGKLPAGRRQRHGSGSIAALRRRRPHHAAQIVEWGPPRLLPGDLYPQVFRNLLLDALRQFVEPQARATQGRILHHHRRRRGNGD